MTTSQYRHRCSEAVRIIQITDTHLLTDPAGSFDGFETQGSLMQVIDLIKRTHWPADFVLATGDLVHDPEPAAYRRLQRTLESLGVPVYCIPGNHDDPDVMRDWLPSERVRLASSVLTDRWQVILLNTMVPEMHGGTLSEQELATLDECLHRHLDHHALVCLHHPPVSIDSPWMDAMSLTNPEHFFAVLDRHPQVRCVLWGHIHQEFDDRYKNVRLLATPSTCVQFKPRVQKHERDDKKPGYRWLVLNSDGSFETGVERLLA
jgi:3',5'-cyclic-AMP phosphodiesterase